MQRTELRNDDALGVIGAPRVVILRTPVGTQVSIEPDAPWGWADPTRLFLNPDSPGVQRYARSLYDRLYAAAQKEAAYRETKGALRSLDRKLRQLRDREDGQ